MGQYYNPVILKKNWKQAKNVVKVSLKCYDFDDNGAKLMEHSYIGNSFVNAVVYLLAEDYKGYPFVWIGDYADDVTTKTGEHCIYDEANSFIYKGMGSDDTKEYKELKASIPDEIHHYKYLINYTKKEYCVIPEKKENVWQVHPLPLLTCSGNSLGGGDYMLSNDEYDYKEDGRIGSWAFNRIGITNDKREIVGMTQIDGYFPLDW